MHDGDLVPYLVILCSKSVQTPRPKQVASKLDHAQTGMYLMYLETEHSSALLVMRRNQTIKINFSDNVGCISSRDVLY